ncbi:unnamed protein product [Staurois parvus]|uniref:Uncharacterized protein n=1 Tax=Staurois parvus TaxID=386267 RepID=A0ABN9DUL4_9NEOB|nr:unnamed protein product [Staurois parvus]
MPHISAHLSCPFNVTRQCHLSMPISASVTYQCLVCTYQCASVPPNSASQCRLSVPYISVMYQCCLSVPISDACQSPSVQPTSASSSVSITASLAHISEREKSLIYKTV